MGDQGDVVDTGTSDGVQSVDVQVTLTGGVCYSSILPSNSPILKDLHVMLAMAHGPSSPQPSIFMQLPLDGGRAACSFMSTSLISVITRPPVLIQSPPIYAAASGPAPGAGAPDHVRIDDFLTPDENKQAPRLCLGEGA